MSSTFEKLMKDPVYQQLLEQVPEDERPKVKKAIKNLCEQFERNVMEPIESLKNQ